MHSLIHTTQSIRTYRMLINNANKYPHSFSFVHSWISLDVWQQRHSSRIRWSWGNGRLYNLCYFERLRLDTIYAWTRVIESMRKLHQVQYSSSVAHSIFDYHLSFVPAIMTKWLVAHGNYYTSEISSSIINHTLLHMNLLSRWRH